jgi:hypothetical protein
MTSDTLDIRGPIPLTRVGVQVRSVLSDVCFVQLVARQHLAHTVPKVSQGVTTLRRKEDQPVANLATGQLGHWDPPSMSAGPGF